MNARRVRIAIIALLAIGAGALREFMFLNLYYQIDFVQHDRMVSYAHSMFQGWTQGMDLAALIRLKWVLSVGFAAGMLGLAIVLARLRFGDHRYTRTLIFGYVGLGLLALALHVAGGAAALAGMKLLHALQYPVVLILIWAGSLLPRTGRA